MITKAHSIERLPTMLEHRRISFVAEPVVPVGAVLFEDSFPSAGPTKRLVTSSATAKRLDRRGDQTGEFWETLSYAALWVCGWICISLCFL
jgi:hypothetical protein